MKTETKQEKNIEGQNEIWKDIPGFTRYQASSHGRIKGSRGNVLSINLSRHGYPKYIFTGNGKRTTILGHKAVALAFMEKPSDKNLQINHINGIKNDNRPQNLEWITCKENIRHAVRLGLMKGKPGEENPASKIADCQIDEMIKIIDLKFYTSEELAIMFGVTRGAIWYHANKHNRISYLVNPQRPNTSGEICEV